MNGTIVNQGRFTADGTNQVVAIRSDIDWMWVYNETILNDAALGTDSGAQFYWQRGMTDGRGVEYRKLGTVVNDPMTTVQIAADAGFFLRDTSGNPLGAAVAETGITNITLPVVSTGNTGSLTTGSVVRLQADTGVPNICGFDFEVDTVVANNSFKMRYTLATAPGAVGAGDGTYRHVAFDPMYYPTNRFVVNISQAAAAVVTCSVTHLFTVGQQVRMSVPSEFGMIEMDGLLGTITAISTANNTITLNIDSSAFTAFAFPGAAAVPFTWSVVTPVGESTAQALASAVNILGDATVNNAALQMILTAGANGPAGVNTNVIYWVAGKSFSVDNQ